MKIKPEHFKALEHNIHRTIRKNRMMGADYVLNGLSETRYLFDLFYKARLTRWTCDILYKYLDDTHIKSALKKAVITFKA